MIQTETRLKVADNSELKNFYAYVYWEAQAVSMQTSAMLSFVR